MPLQTSYVDWTRGASSPNRNCTIEMNYDFVTGEGPVRKLCDTRIVIKFNQAHDVNDSAEAVAIAIKNFAELMFEEAAIEVAV